MQAPQQLPWRSATPDDIDDIMRVERSSFPEGIQEVPDVFHERIHTFPEGFLVVPDDKGKAIGYICSELWRESDVPGEHAFALGHSIRDSHHRNGKLLYVSSMAIHPEHRRSGFGQRLFKHLIDHVGSGRDHVENVVLLVGHSWENARRIYREDGFRELYTIPGFFQPRATDPYDGIVMTRPLRQKAAPAARPLSRTR